MQAKNTQNIIILIIIISLTLGFFSGLGGENVYADEQLISNNNQPQWEIFSFGTGSVKEGVSLSLDEGGRPAIVYITQESLNYIYFNGQNWEEPVIVDFWSYDIDGRLMVGSHPVLKFDREGNPKIVYNYVITRTTPPLRQNVLKYAYFENGEWKKEIIPGGYYGDISFDISPTTNYPAVVLSILPWDIGGSLSFFFFNGETWEKPNISSLFGGTLGGGHNSLVFDSSGTPFIIYQNNNWDNEKCPGLNLISSHSLNLEDWKDPEKWQHICLYGGWGRGYGNDLKDKDQNLFVNFYISGSCGFSCLPHCSGCLKYIVFNSQQKEVLKDEVIDCFYQNIPFQNSPISLDFDSFGSPFIAYADANNLNSLKIAWFNGENWQKEIVDSEKGSGSYNSLAITKNNVPIIAYYDQINQALKLAILGGIEAIKTETTKPIISNLGQFKSDGQVIISEGGITTEDIVVFKATVSDPDNEQIKLQIELKEFDQSFNEQDLLESDFVSSGNTATITKTDLIDSQYHWRARTVDSRGATSDWQEFGTVGNVDFEVKLPLSTKAATLAKELINYPYLWGGKGWDYRQSLFVTADTIKTGYHFYNGSIKSIDFGSGVDCSGLIMWSYNRSFDPFKPFLSNFVKYEGANGQYRYNTMPITESELQPGDVIFFDWDFNGYIDHVVMYVGESGGFDVVNAADKVRGIIRASKDDLKNLPSFIGFKQVISALPPAIVVTASSPIDLTLTDPDGFTITSITTIPSDLEYLREIPGVLYYSEMEGGIDGRPIDYIYSPVLKTGDYIIQVIPEPDALPTDTYTLKIEALINGETVVVVLADNVPISDIPRSPYILRSTGTEIIPIIPAFVDFDPDTLNLKSKGQYVTVNLELPIGYNINDIDLESIRLNNQIAIEPKSIEIGDYDNNGIPDLIIKFNRVAVQNILEVGEKIKITISGNLISGEFFEGSDIIKIISKGK